jgi:molybdenum cofactor cytidylyltransferase
VNFARLAIDDAVGAVCAHTLRLRPGLVFKKGRRLSLADIAELRASGHQHIVAARLDPGDLGEDEAAARVAEAVAGQGLRLDVASTGRCNLHAGAAGLLQVEAERICALNQIDEAVTLATLPPLSPVSAGSLAATIKIIPFAVPQTIVERCAQIAAGGLVTVLPFDAARVQIGLLLTRLPSVPESLLDRAAGSQRVRAHRLGGQIVAEERCPHTEEAVAEALGRLLSRGCSQVWVLGASAIVDRQDVIPSAVVRIGGHIEHFGMPVDPGNLLLLARYGKTPVLGVPGCARSLRRSGFDWVIERLAVGLPVGAATLQGMGVGGLLSESPLRPQPRSTALSEPKVAAIVLAAGQSRRMGDKNKLLQPVGNSTVLSRVLAALRHCGVSSVVVVTGHEAEAVQALVAQSASQSGGSEARPRCVHNPDYAAGLSTSLRVGIAALSSGDGGPGQTACDGALICLGDMPRVESAHIEALLAAFDPSDGREVIVPTYGGQRGNPVLWSSRYFPELQQLQGDSGARALLERHADVLCYVPMPDDGVTIDVDTPDALKRVQDQG